MTAMRAFLMTLFLFSANAQSDAIANHLEDLAAFATNTIANAGDATAFAQLITAAADIMRDGSIDGCGVDSVGRSNAYEAIRAVLTATPPRIITPQFAISAVLTGIIPSDKNEILKTVYNGIC